ncbi:MAG: polysaccharide deacetylase family protein [Actinobacteria bacterium]|nr:polysaccharide deacetylase family protein [Actinomycetota bacterium]
MNANNEEDMRAKGMGEQPSGGSGSSKLIMPLAVALIVLALAIVGAAAWFSFGSKAADGVVIVTEPPPADETAGNQPTVPAETKTSLEKTAFVPLAFPASLPSPAQVVKLPILMFHHTGEPPAGADELRQGLTVSTADLEAQMAYLKQAGYQPVSETQLFKALYGGAPLPPNPVMLTFDDGYVDNYQVVVPILEKYDFPATFYIVTDLVGTPEYMSWDQIVELDRKGMDIGSHTAAHRDLTTLGAADLQAEVTGSAETLKAHLGHPVYWFCYPAGKYDADVIASVKESGYLLATSTDPGEQQSSDDPFVLMRYRVRSDTGLEGFKEMVR